jgi:aspartyl-tRNA(Asn)/glutamyl-tRNA(Gln) amidotransferase subunit B
MSPEYEPVIGLEVHAELQTQSKMFCTCRVVDPTEAEPNTAVCPVCAGMPGTLPVVNRMAVEYAMRVALALECTINETSVFARKNYFYPDLPKGYQITQYEQPLAEHGKLIIHTSTGERTIRVTRVHLEEDTGKLTHMAGASASAVAMAEGAPNNSERPYTLVDLNRAGVPLLEIVSEPDMHSIEEARIYAEGLREILRYVEVNSGDMEKGVIRFEANVSIRPVGELELGKRVEIKNLNSFRALERASAFEIERQGRVLSDGNRVEQETLGWDDIKEQTYSQRSKEEAHDYRYFPEPDLPPLVVDRAWIERVRLGLPELPHAKFRRFVDEYGLTEYAASRLVESRRVADYFEKAVSSDSVSARSLANWIVGELFAQANLAGGSTDPLKIPPGALSELVGLVERGEINQATGKQVLAEMAASGKRASEIVARDGLKQVSDTDLIARVVTEALAENPTEVASFKAGKTGVANYLFGQAMKKAAGKANPQVVKAELEKQLSNR